jgi:photosystem II stability/assembly factor-like uncharacterized protein
MSPARILASVALALIGLMTIGSAPAQNWKQTFSSTPVSWSSIQSSADGSRLAAFGKVGNASVVYTSRDSGATWASNSAPFAGSTCLASSADFTKILAVARGGGSWISTNFGGSWAAVPSLPAMTWSSAASSADGVVLVAAAVSDQVSTNGGPVRGNGSIYTSTDSGVTWRSNTIPCDCSPNPSWLSVASSANGERLVAAGGPLGLFRSANAGTNWSQLAAPVIYAVAVASSADGSRLLVTGIDDLYNNVWAVSTNSGQSWRTTIAPSGGNSWPFVASSADGIELVAVDPYNGIYTSTDAGLNWVLNADPREGPFPGNWQSVASSADGSKLVALAEGGKIYTWQYQPVLSITRLATNAVVSWPRSPLASAFALQQNSDLSKTYWTDPVSPIHDDGTNLSVTCGPLTNTLFFRLKK